MEHTILVRYGETWLKSFSVRRQFERIMINNIRFAMPDAKFRIFPGRIWVMTNKSSKLFSKIFGIDSYSPVLVREKDIDKIKAASLQLTKKWRCGSFAVRSRRTDKSFPLNSRQIENDVGKIIDFPCDLSNPKNTLYIEIRDHA